MSKLTYTYYLNHEDDIRIKCEGDMAQFDTSLLNIGNLSLPAKPIEVLSVMFDLEGFTNFAKQVDPHLTLPGFVSDFSNWLFTSIKYQLKAESEDTLWAELPFYAKFLGDGALFLWHIDLDKITEIQKDHNRNESLNTFICNIIAAMHDLCNDGYPKFYEAIKGKYSDIPKRLRCGIARGSVVPLGGGKDYIGPCINISARLQKFYGLSFAFSARGINKSCFSEDYKKQFILKSVSIRGIGDNELIYVIREEFLALPDPDQANFSKP